MSKKRLDIYHWARPCEDMVKQGFKSHWRIVRISKDETKAREFNGSVWPLDALILSAPLRRPSNGREPMAIIAAAIRQRSEAGDV